MFHLLKKSNQKIIKKFLNSIFFIFPKNKLVEKAPLIKRIFKGVSWILVGTVVSKIFLLISSIFVARILGHLGYGELGILRSTLNSFSMIANMGLGITATKFIAENYTSHKKKDIGEIVGFTLIFSFVFSSLASVLMLLFSNNIAVFINSPQLINEIRISVVVLFFIIVNSAQVGVLAGFEKFNIVAKGAIISSIFSFLMQIIGARYFGVIGALIGFGFNFFVLFVFYTYEIVKLMSKEEILIVYNKFKKYKMVFFKMSLPAALSGILVSPIFWYCNTLIVKQKGGYGEMAILDAVNQLQQILLFIPAALTQLALPILSSYSQNKEKFKETFNVNLVLSSIVVCLLILIIIPFSTNIMNLYGNHFKSGRLILIIMTLSTLPMIYCNLIGQTLIAKSRVWIAFSFNFVWGICLILFSIVFVEFKKMGAQGYAYAYLLSYIVLMLLNVIYYRLSIRNKFAL